MGPWLQAITAVDKRCGAAQGRVRRVGGFLTVLPLAFVMIAGPQIISAVFLATSELDAALAQLPKRVAAREAILLHELS